MAKNFFHGNQARLYAQMKENSSFIMISCIKLRKTSDECYSFYTGRDFLRPTGPDGKEPALLSGKNGQSKAAEKVFLLPPSLMAERWTGRRIKPDEASGRSGIGQPGFASGLKAELRQLAAGGNYEHPSPDLYRPATPCTIDEIEDAMRQTLVELS